MNFNQKASRVISLDGPSFEEVETFCPIVYDEKAIDGNESQPLQIQIVQYIFFFSSFSPLSPEVMSSR